MQALSDILNINNNNNVNVVKNNNNKTLQEVRIIVEKIIAALGNPNAHDYYCKIAWALPEYMIWNNLEASAKGRNQVKLFTWLCQEDMKRRTMA